MAGRQVWVIPVTPTWLKVAATESYCFVQEKYKGLRNPRKHDIPFKRKMINNFVTTASHSVP